MARANPSDFLCAHLPWGNDAPECGRACYDKNGGCLNRGQDVGTCALGLHVADRTPEGLHDMGGNVSEWVSDGSTTSRVARGGSFIDDADKLKSSARTVLPPSVAHVAVGFRCAMDAAAKP